MMRTSALLWMLFWTLFAAGFARRTPTRCDKTDPRALNSFLWTVKRLHPHPPSYLFGTIHVPYTRVWDFVPERSKRAFQSSTSVFFELDLTDPVTMSKLASCQLLPNGESLRSLLPRELYLRLKRHLEYVRHMMPAWVRAEQRFHADYLFKAIAGDWERKRPVWVMLMVNSLTEWDVRGRGAPVLDLFLAREAERMGKKTGAVENVEEQCRPLNGLNFSQVLFALNQTLRQHEGVREGGVRGPFTTEDLISHYNCGDLSSIIFSHDTSQLPHFLNSSLPDDERSTAAQIDHYLRQELIYKRNERMAHRVSALLRKSPSQSFFFAFGAGHFLGNHSVLDILRQEGYVVEHTAAHEPLTPTRPEVETMTLTLTDRSPTPTQEWTSESPEEDLPHLLEPDSLSQLEEFGRHQRPRKTHRHHGKQQRLFSDLWVRLGLSTPTPSETWTPGSEVMTGTQRTRQQEESVPPSITDVTVHVSGSAVAVVLSCFSSLVFLLQFTS
ncbi:metalloprotease TIKI2 [Trichomycterus rosablanca]|uniref:metalloprotease TIKI2 n=1 Tax=Trichomycterus rosablanca TaxID=2290929 RepID=UPI002F34FE93